VSVADVNFGTGATVITLSYETSDTVRVTITERDLSATHVVYGAYSDGFDSLADFFTGLAADWRRWEGERVYESLEHDLRFAAVHDGHVRLNVRLWQSSDPQGWSVETRLALGPGEELARVAAELAAFIRE
jgi:Family of unknown function (DUF6228)